MIKKLVIVTLTFIVLSGCMEEEDLRVHLSYEGEQLRYIQAPFGGIGTGNVLIDAYGAIRELEIFNRPSVDELPPELTFFALRTVQDETGTQSRILQGEFLDEYPNPFGKPSQQQAGLPRFEKAVFHNAYPVVLVDLSDEEVPLLASLEAWSPFIPVDTKNSSIPAVIMEWTLKNPGKEAVEYSLAFSMGNPLHTRKQNGEQSTEGVVLEAATGKEWSSLTFRTPLADSLQPDYGAFRVLFPSSATISSPLEQGDWHYGARRFWKDFSNDGELSPRIDTVTCIAGEELAGAISISGKLEAEEELTIPFILSWHIPYRRLEASQAFGDKTIENIKVRNYYTTIYRSIDELSEYVIGNLDYLKQKTHAFSHAMITSTIPPEVLDATISNMASLKTNLLMQDEQGNVHAFEGLGNDFGCCPGNCTHVWNYAQTMAALYPSLEQNMRETAFLHSTFENGYQCFRTVFPLSDSYFKNISADGQMGNIMRVYREWKMSGDQEWLAQLWPSVKAALEFSWKGVGDLPRELSWMNNQSSTWDPHREGVLRGRQHTTYDIDFYDANMFTGALYLGALKACSEMASYMNEPQLSVEYLQQYERGLKNYKDLLWNGSYFIQENSGNTGQADASREQSYQFGQGCHSDQLLGQFLAFNSGLGYLLDSSLVKTTLLSIYGNNFREHMGDFENLQRVYAANDEAGLVLCTWPEGGEPRQPFVYSDEVWTGVEYQLAASLIYAGMLEEGLNITRAARGRYQGSNRNPFAEIESGRYYARALASWGVYQAMAGYEYDGIKKTMKYTPAIGALPIRFFWSTADTWGTIEASRAAIILKCHHGRLELNKLQFAGKKFFTFREFIPNTEVDIEFTDDILTIDFARKMQLVEGQEFRLDIP